MNTCMWPHACAHTRTHTHTCKYRGAYIVTCTHILMGERALFDRQSRHFFYLRDLSLLARGGGVWGGGNFVHRPSTTACPLLRTRPPAKRQRAGTVLTQAKLMEQNRGPMQCCRTLAKHLLDTHWQFRPIILLDSAGKSIGHFCLAESMYSACSTTGFGLLRGHSSSQGTRGHLPNFNGGRALPATFLAFFIPTKML